MKKRKRYITTVEDGMLHLPEGVTYFAEVEYVVTRGMYGSLFLFNTDDWSNYEKRVRRLDNNNHIERRFKRFVICGSAEIERVGDGLLLPEVLCEFINLPYKGSVKVELIPRTDYQYENGTKKGSLADVIEDSSYALVLAGGNK